MRKPRWTAIEVNLLKQYCGERKSVKEIANLLKRPYTGVTDKKSRLGITKPNRLSSSDPKLIAQLIKFRLAGWAVYEIAEVFDVTQSNISTILISNGFKRVFPHASRKRVSSCEKWDELDTHLLRKYLRKGYSIDRLCRYFPYRSEVAVRGKIKKLTRYWISDEEQADRKRIRAKELEWRVY